MRDRGWRRGDGSVPTVTFTNHLRGVAPAAPVESGAPTVRAALEDVFAAHPRLRGYILDDRGGLRRHVAVFVDGDLLPRGDTLDGPVGPASEIFVMQALSGGSPGGHGRRNAS